MNNSDSHFIKLRLSLAIRVHQFIHFVQTVLEQMKINLFIVQLCKGEKIKIMKTKLITKFTSLLLFITINTFSQTPIFQWAKSMGVFSIGIHRGHGIVVDASGNVYTVGQFYNTTDFDPGVGVYNLVSAGSADIFISKLDAAGNFVWAKRIGSTSSDYGYGIALDASGNVYTTGTFLGTADFDPGIGTFNLSSAGSNDVFISKLDAAGNFVWAKNVGGAGIDYGYSIAVDASSNVYTTGYFNSTGDFDPNPGLFNLTSAGLADIFISKLDASGNFVWAKSIGDVGDDIGYSIAIDASANVLTTGSFSVTVDFDPGIGVFNIASAGMSDVFVSKLSTSGNFIWAKGMGGAGLDYGNAITTDASSNVYSNGSFESIGDFDPGAGTFNLTSAGLADVFVSKLDGIGNFTWARAIGGTGNDYGYGIALDASANVYSTGNFETTADFDPGLGVVNLTSAGSSDSYLSKLNTSGNFIWATSFGNGNGGYSRAIAVDLSTNVYNTGTFAGTLDFDPGIGVFNLTASGLFDIFVHKMSQCSTPAQPGSITGNTLLCSGSSQSYSINPVGGATSYTWTLPSGWIGSSVTNSISVSSGTMSGIISVAASNTCGASSSQTLSVNVSSTPSTPGVISGPATLCAGAGATTYSIASVIGATSYAWVLPIGWSGTSSTNTISATPGTSGSITVTASNFCGTSAAQTLSVTVNALPIITVNSGSICVGSSFTIIPSGANTYTISGGLAIVSPTANTSYSVTGTSSAGCLSQSLAISNVSVIALPSVNASTSNTLLCLGQTATLTASGALTYTWNPGGAGSSIAVSPTVTSTYTITGTNASGCTNTSVFTQSVSPCTGIFVSSANIENEINIYPNPFSTTFIVTTRVNENALIEIYNSLGSIIYSTEIENVKTEIDLSNQSSGIYFVIIKTENNSITKKIIKL